MSDIDYAVDGFDAAGCAAGIKKSGAPDLAMVMSRTPCRAAALFTRNAFPAAPVVYDRQLLAFNPDQVYGVVINSGNANACTGVIGDANARLTAEAAEFAISAAHGSSVFVMSTGVIGVQLPLEKLTEAIPTAVNQLDPQGWDAASRAIMTTDTRPKLATRTVRIDGAPVKFTGMAKGAGMIHPNMATMLAVIATDAQIAQPLLQRALKAAADKSFNRISVDGDTSTNDTLLLLANGLAANQEIMDTGSGYEAFVHALTDLSLELAQGLVRDAEGATKFVTVTVNGAEDDAAAHQAANTVATSPLVKTAFYGNDANWGRLLAAIGRAGIHVDPESCHLFIAGRSGEVELPELQLVDGGMPTDYQETDAAAIFAQPEIDVRIELGLGHGRAIVWTSDLSHEYVSINADYRT